MRLLNPAEKNLILCLLNEIADNELKSKLTIGLDTVMVYDMNGGSMGSIHFISANDGKRRMKTCIAEKIFMDADEIPIMVYLDLDENNELFELDIWKGDFSATIDYPVCE